MAGHHPGHVGMHRSGTSLVAQVLEEIGLFLGWRKDINHEAWFFLRLNDWLLHQCGGAWDQPAPIRHLLANPLGRRMVGDYLRFMLGAPRAATFLGPWQYLRYRSVAAIDRPWRWKDPRNTFTLPLWLDLFPEARIVHIYRHGVDVAASLKRRQSESVDQSQSRLQRRRWIHAFAIPRRGGFAESSRCAELDDALRLWSASICTRHVLMWRILGIEPWRSAMRIFWKIHAASFPCWQRSALCQPQGARWNRPQAESAQHARWPISMIRCYVIWPSAGASNCGRLVIKLDIGTRSRMKGHSHTGTAFGGRRQAARSVDEHSVQGTTVTGAMPVSPGGGATCP